MPELSEFTSLAPWIAGAVALWSLYPHLFLLFGQHRYRGGVYGSAEDLTPGPRGFEPAESLEPG